MPICSFQLPEKNLRFKQTPFLIHTPFFQKLDPYFWHLILPSRLLGTPQVKVVLKGRGETQSTEWVEARLGSMFPAPTLLC